MNPLKTAARCLGWAWALPCVARYAVLRALLDDQRAMTSCSERIARVPGLLGVYSRQAYYRHALAGVGQDVYFGFMTLFSKRTARIGDRVYIGRFCTVGDANIEDDAMLADGVQVLSGRHQHGRPDEAADAPMRDNEHQYTQVTIGRGAWIGANAVVMADVGPGAVVGAGAVVVKPVAPNTKAGGVPAKQLA